MSLASSSGASTAMAHPLAEMGTGVMRMIVTATNTGTGIRDGGGEDVVGFTAGQKGILEWGIVRGLKSCIPLVRWDGDGDARPVIVSPAEIELVGIEVNGIRLIIGD